MWGNNHSTELIEINKRLDRLEKRMLALERIQELDMQTLRREIRGTAELPAEETKEGEPN
jgi:hypothetical protein